MTSPDAPKLTSDKLSSIIIYGAVIAGDGQPMPLTLKRQILALDAVKASTALCSCRFIPCECHVGVTRPDGPPVRVNISRPPALTTESRIEFALNKLIGRGKSGIVYSTKTYSPSSFTHAIAPFIVKFAARKRNKNLLREAWFYDELQLLQGSTIPRCYGYFEAELPEGCIFIPWKTAEVLSHEKNYEELGDDHFKPYGPFDPTYRSTLARFETATCVTVLLLEQLDGPFLQSEIPKAQLNDAIDQVCMAYSDISHLGVEHGDVCCSNILAVTKSTVAEPSPISHKTYPFRIIDFELSQKSYFSESLIQHEHEADLAPIRSGLVGTS